MIDKTLHPNVAFDGMIAEEVMGWPIVQAGGEEWFDKAIERGVKFPFLAVWPEGGSMLYMDDSGLNTKEWKPSADTRNASDALHARFVNKNYRVVLVGPHFRTNRGVWTVTIYPADEKISEPLAFEDDPRFEMAVCRAMLKAVRREGSGTSPSRSPDKP